MIGDILLIDLFVRPCSFNLQEIVIQNDFTEKKLEHELQMILSVDKRNEMFEDYFDLENKLGGKGSSE